MDVLTAIASYLIIWWLALFMVLPIGAKSQIESGEVVKGSAKSAPINPQIKKKLIWASLLALVFWGIFQICVFYSLSKS